jgi:hypothetical protein
MNDLDLKKVLISRLVTYMNPVSANAVQEMLQMSARELEEALDAYITERKQKESDDAVVAQARELKRASRYDHCWVYVLRNVSINDKKLVDNDSNRQMMESLLQPHEQEEPTSAIYATIAKTGRPNSRGRLRDRSKRKPTDKPSSQRCAAIICSVSARRTVDYIETALLSTPGLGPVELSKPSTRTRLL